MCFYVLCPSFDFHNSQVPICSFIQSVGGKCIKNKKKKKIKSAYFTACFSSSLVSDLWL